MMTVDLLAPEVLAAVIAAMATLVSMTAMSVGWLLKTIYRANTQRLNSISDGFKAIDTTLQKHEKQNQDEHAKIWTSMQELMTDIKLNSQKSEHTKASLESLENTVKTQQSTIFKYIEKLSMIDSKLESVFRLMDSPVRITDINGGFR